MRAMSFEALICCILLSFGMASDDLIFSPAVIKEVEGAYECGLKQFACGNTTVCLERRYHCDGIKHCDNGEDESGCSDIHGSLDSLVKAITHQEKKLQDVFYDESFDNCSLDNVPPFCECRYFSFIYCLNHNLTKVPEGLGKSLTKMVLTNVSLFSLSKGAFSEYSELRIIHIELNRIPVLNSGSFFALPKVTFLLLMENEIRTIENGAFVGLKNLRWLLLQENNLENLNMSVLSVLPTLEVMDLTGNLLTELETFPKNLEHLFWLGLGKNKLKRIKADTFSYLSQLEVLILKNNLLEDIAESSFSNMEKLLELDISYNQMSFLKPRIFYRLRNLEKLNLEFNSFTSLEMNLFMGLYSLKSLDLQGFTIDNIHIQMFNQLKELKFVYFERFVYCSYAPSVRLCSPKTDGLSSTEHLLVFPALRISVCIMAIMSCVGNAVVLSWRGISRKEEDKIVSLFIKNLALADLLMGIYLVIIAVKDFSFRDSYMKYAHFWMNCTFCSLCGVTAMVSSETSVFILLLITFERHHCIRTNVRVITVNGARYSVAFAWILGSTLSILPMFLYQGYYASNGLCFPLHINYPYNQGYEYSAFIFLGLNLLAVVLIICLYTNMFLTIKRDRQSARPVILKKHEDAVLALRFSFIVMTDCLCWGPIVCIKLLALFGVAISHRLSSVVVVSILPINSSLNPLLYTIAAPTELRRRIEKCVNRLISWLQRMDCIIRTNVSTTTTPNGSVIATENRFIPLSAVTSGELDLCIAEI